LTAQEDLEETVAVVGLLRNTTATEVPAPERAQATRAAVESVLENLYLRLTISDLPWWEGGGEADCVPVARPEDR
jgi:hypothetical protein